VGSLSVTDPGQDYYVTHFQVDGGGATPTEDIEGKLRLVREGAQISGYFFDSGTDNWTLIDTGPSDMDHFLVELEIWGHYDTPDVRSS